MGEKALYKDCHEYILDLLKIGGLYVLDDTLLKFAPKVRVGLGKRVDSFLQELNQDSRLEILTLPLGHGLTIARKIKN
jgi:predicted O-methyltransferase YrrM